MDQAVVWYVKAANQNNLAAENKLFQYYFAKQDTADAFIWVRKAAEQGDAGAQFNLGSFYFNGWGAPKDNKQARVWYAKAAAQGFPDAADVLKKLDAVK
jgi:TPR repeat protein